MKKYLLIICSTLILAGCADYNNQNASSNYSQSENNNTATPAVNIGESKDSVDSRLGVPVTFKKNEDGTYTAVYASAYDQANASRAFAASPFATPSFTPNSDPTNRKTQDRHNQKIIKANNNKIIILYDSKLKVKHYRLAQAIN